MSVIRKCSFNLYNRLLECKSFNFNTNLPGLHKCLHYTKEKDPAPLFFDKNVKSLMRHLTRIDINKVYRKRRMETTRLEKPVYKFMTDEQLKIAREEAEKRIDDMIQMPPVLKVREPVDDIISKDPELQGLEEHSMIFTDITFGIRNCDRLIVVRETDGTLRKANWDERDRMNQTYFPLQGRDFCMPKMFEEEYLQNLYKRKEYAFILDKACVQYEPDDVTYQELTSKVYTQVNNNNDFDLLRSTRHFGPFVFYLAWHKEIDNLLIELIETSEITEAESLIKLYGLLHNIQYTESSVKLIEQFIKQHANKKGPLELAVQAYKELEKERKELQENINTAHGQV